VPHKETRFPGWNKEKSTLDAKVHRDHIFGAHVAAWYKQVKADADSNPDEKDHQFSTYIADKLTPESLEKLYKAAHAEIRKDPMKKNKKEKKAGAKSKAYNIARTTRKQKRQVIKRKVEALRKKLNA